MPAELVPNKIRSKGEDQRPQPKRQGLMKASEGHSDRSRSIKENSKQKPPRNQSQKKGINDADFEQMFGKDIDQFLEDSEWDI